MLEYNLTYIEDSIRNGSGRVVSIQTLRDGMSIAHDSAVFGYLLMESPGYLDLDGFQTFLNVLPRLDDGIPPWTTIQFLAKVKSELVAAEQNSQMIDIALKNLRK